MSDKTKYIVNTITFFVILIGILLLNVIIPDNEISVSERRYLRTFPTVSLSAIFDSSFMDDFDKYVTDQFVFRDTFRKLKAHMELDVLRKKDNNDLFVRNGMIFENFHQLNERGVRLTADRMNSVYNLHLQGMNVFYTIIPDKNFYLEGNHLSIDYNRLISIMNDNVENMQYIDIFDTLSLDSFYRTDIHWRQEKLFDTARRIGEFMNFNVTDNFTRRHINNFRGSYFGQLPRWGLRPDTLIYLTNDITKNAIVYNHETSTYSSVYNLDMINNVDMYDIFLSGAVAILDITNPLAKSDRELIIFRDSFASSFTPLILEDFRKVTLIDLRYVDSRFLDKFVTFENQDVLFMYGVNIINNGVVLR